MSQLTIKCPHCEQRLEFDRIDLGAVINCPACGLSVPLVVPGLAVPPPPPQVIKGEIIKHNESSGGGCLIQIIGLIFILSGIWTFGITALLGIVMIIAGGRMARKLACSNCGIVLASHSIKVCPACRCQFN